MRRAGWRGWIQRKRRNGISQISFVKNLPLTLEGAAEGRIRRKMIGENLLKAVIGLPANLFIGTGIPAAGKNYCRRGGQSELPAIYTCSGC